MALDEEECLLTWIGRCAPAEAVEVDAQLHPVVLRGILLGEAGVRQAHGVTCVTLREYDRT